MAEGVTEVDEEVAEAVKEESNSPIILHVCEYCSKEFKSKYKLQTHLMIHTGEKPFCCQFCGKQFNKKTNLVQHIRTHLRTSAGDMQVCSHCCAVFSDKQNLQLHISSAHRLSVHERFKFCKYCNKAYSPAYIKTHMRLHTSVNSYACEFCHKTFGTRTAHMLHVRRHSGSKPYSCKLCNKTFYDKTYLKIHMRYHTNVKPYECDLCGRRFAENSNWRKHLRTHSSEKQFKCNFCNKEFKYIESYRIHVNIHTQAKLYFCDKCDMSFPYKRKLTRHQKKHEQENGGPLFCDACGKKFSNKSSLARHLKSHIVSIPEIVIQPGIDGCEMMEGTSNGFNLIKTDNFVVVNVAGDVTDIVALENLIGVHSFDEVQVNSEPSAIDSLLDIKSDCLEHMEEIYSKDIFVIRSAQTNEYFVIEK